MVYWSQAWQDEFVSIILNYKRNGYFLDIGSHHAQQQSNTYHFESELGWTGICIEQDSSHNKSYDKRSCNFLNEDATKTDYKSVLDQSGYPSKLDYLSLDIDENSTAALLRMPLNEYRFRVITVEHDQYRVGSSYKNEQRNILQAHDYYLLFPDILVPLGCGMGGNLPFEDWWIDPSSFNMEKLSKIGSANMYPDYVVAMLKSKPDIYVI
jgi:hypothetical protein